jgi:hypothetical protein
MSDDKNLLVCYNRGCGQKFYDNDNKEGIKYFVYLILFFDRKLFYFFHLCFFFN